MASVYRYIKRRQWTRAWRELIRLLDAGVLDVSDYDKWGKLAGIIERGMGRRWDLREKFWREINDAVARAERRAGVRTHKGFVYFKIGTMSLYSGRTFPTAVRWLMKAFEEDERFYKKPRQESAYRMSVIIQAFERFCRGIRSPPVRKHVTGIVNKHRGRIGRFIGGIYDRIILDPMISRRVDTRHFDRLLHRTPYQAIPMQSYRGAEWLCRHKHKINLTILEKYGLAQAIVVLCGSTVEGILLEKQAVRRRARRGMRRQRRPNYNLDRLMIAYIEGFRGAPELTAGLVFVWFSRNQIHPQVQKNLREDFLDMDFAEFIWTLTGYVIREMAKRTRRK